MYIYIYIYMYIYIYVYIYIYLGESPFSSYTLSISGLVPGVRVEEGS